MKIIAHGIDLVDFGRIEQMLDRHPQRFADRVFTPTEQADADTVKNRVEKLAGRFAAIFCSAPSPSSTSCSSTWWASSPRSSA